MKFSMWLIALLVIVGIVISSVDINLANKQDVELYFDYYDHSTSSNVCFGYTALPALEQPQVFVNDMLVEGLVISEEKTCIPSMFINDGDNLIRLKSGGMSIFFHAERSDDAFKSTKLFKTEPEFFDYEKGIPLLMFLSAVIIFIIPGFLITSKYFKGLDRADFLALTLSFSIFVTVMLSWALDALNVISAGTLLMSLIAVSVFFYYKKQNKYYKVRENNKKVLIILFFIALTLGSELFLYSHHSPWSVYYERQAEVAYEAGFLQKFDQLSYLGRAFTYVPGYVLLRASYSWLAFSSPASSHFVFMVIGNLLLFSSILFFGRTLKFDTKKSTLLIMFLYSSMFIFGWTVLNPLHMYAYSLFLISLGFAMRGSKMAGVFAGLAGLFHASFLVAFPFMFLVLQRKFSFRRPIETIRKPFYYTLIAVIFFFLVYSPILITQGIPNEIQQQNWGYLIKGDIISLGTMSAGFMSLAVIPALFFAWKRRCKRLAAFTILMILLFLFVTYRVNVFLSISAAVLFLSTFKLRSKGTIIVLVMLFTASYGLNVYLYHGESLNDSIMNPFIFLESVSESDSHLLVEPFFGHVSNYFSKRPSLSDLYVEYASPAQYEDALRFINSADYQILEKYDIDYVVTLNATSILGVRDYNYSEYEIEFTELDKIYKNLYFNIHYRRS